MMTLDSATLLLILSAICVLLAVACLASARDTSAGYLRPWGISLLFLTFTSFTFGLRGIAPDWLSVVAGNAALSMTLGLQALAIARFNATTIPPWLLWGPVFIVLLLFPLILDRQDLRNIAVTFLHGGMLAYLSWVLMRRGTPTRGAGQRLLLLSFLGLVTMYFSKLAYETMIDPGNALEIKSTHPMQQVALITYLLAATGAAVGFMLMVLQRAASDAKEHARTMQGVFDAVSESVAMFRRDGTILAINAVGAQRNGTTPQALVGRRIDEVWPPEIARSRLQVIDRVCRKATPEHIEDHRGGYIFNVTVYPVKDIADQVVVFATDVTAMRANEEKRRTAEARFRTIVELATEGIAMIDAHGIITFANQRLHELLGEPSAALAGRSVIDLTDATDRPRFTERFGLIRQHPETPTRQARYGLRHADGHRIEVLLSATHLRDDEGRYAGSVGMITDISEIVATEESLKTNLAHQTELNRKLEDAHNQLLQSEKMASIGQLAAGVAHELNNPIGFVHSNLGTLEHYLEDIFEIASVCEAAAAGRAGLADVEAKKQEKDFAFLKQDIFQLMTESKDGLARVKKIVQDLKDFSRVGESHWQWADLHQGLDSTLNIVWNELKYKCTVAKHYAPDLPRVLCLPSQLNQVFMNLLVNAAQAIEDKGEITITTERLGDDQVRLVFRDTGKGIPPEHMNRLFEPFFTTKPVGKGTGLGLSIAWGIVGRHNGNISVTSSPGNTAFTIILPVQPPSASVTDDAVPPAPTLP